MPQRQSVLLARTGTPGSDREASRTTTQAATTPRRQRELGISGGAGQDYKYRKWISLAAALIAACANCDGQPRTHPKGAVAKCCPIFRRGRAAAADGGVGQRRGSGAVLHAGATQACRRMQGRMQDFREWASSAPSRRPARSRPEAKCRPIFQVTAAYLRTKDYWTSSTLSRRPYQRRPKANDCPFPQAAPQPPRRQMRKRQRSEACDCR